MSIAVAKIIRDGEDALINCRLIKKRDFNVTLKKIQRESLFDVFSNDSVSRRAVQSHAQK